MFSIRARAKRRKQNILFLDDNSLRIKYVENSILNENLYITETAQETIDTLNKEPFWDTISLDHDLNGEIFVDSDRKDCGMEVVRHLIKKILPINLIIIHSLNFEGATLMTKTLREHNYNVIQQPFNLL